MPFQSSQQSKACFATGGFGGKVDCEEWAHKTDYKRLPKKKKKKKKHMAIESMCFRAFIESFEEFKKL